jgi:pimeloyl-ACP methyl ester carboxylesterase
VAVATMLDYLHQRPGDWINEIQVPIIGINSDMFPVNVSGNRALARNYKMIPMNGVGHFIQLEDTATFNHLLNSAVLDILFLNSKKK